MEQGRLWDWVQSSVNGNWRVRKAFGLGTGSCKGRLWSKKDLDSRQGYVKGDYGAKKTGLGAGPCEWSLWSKEGFWTGLMVMERAIMEKERLLDWVRAL